MRRLSLLCLLLLPCLALGGCQLSEEVENQAYVMALGVDRLADGELELTVRVPKIGKGSDAESGQASEGESFLTFIVAADSWPRALEALQQATPRRMNLSHIELIVFSQALAKEPGFPALSREIARTRHLYTTARLVVCRDAARDFILAGETIIGTRMSSELRAMLVHYAQQGYIPETSFAEVVFASDSVYSDPVGIWGYVEAGQDATTDGQVLETPMKQRFCGAALFSRGAFVRALSLGETRLLNLIRGQTKPLLFEWNGRGYALKPVRAARRRVEWREGRPRLALTVRLSVEEVLPPDEAAGLSEGLKAVLEGLIRSCQAEDCDPFGFAEIAARRFVTIPAWLDSDWRSLYAGAELAVDVTIENGIS